MPSVREQVEATQRRQSRRMVTAIVVGIFIALVALSVADRVQASECHRVSASHPDVLAGWNPTRWRGCTQYGLGLASHWGGPGVARNDCLWPWTDCTPITITNMDRESAGYGLSITVQPTMFGDLWQGRPEQKIVDLDPAAVAALGLDWSRGVYPVRVEPARALPDTALE